MIDNRIKLIRIASWVGIFGNGFLALLKIVVGLLSHSMAVISDGIDSATDIISSLITLFTSKIISKSPDLKHPYGHYRAETIATQILAFIIFFAGAQLLLAAISGIINNETALMPEIISIYVTVFSIIGKIILAAVQFSIGKKTDSSMVKANAKNMLNDTIISLGILAGLVLVFIFKLPIIDSVVSLIVSIWIMISGINIFKDTNSELMEGNDNMDLYRKIFECVDSVEGVFNPHRVRIRKLSNLYVVDIDIEVEGDLTVHEAHKKATGVEDSITQNIENIYDVLVHIEPKGHLDTKEKFGVNR